MNPLKVFAMNHSTQLIQNTRSARKGAYTPDEPIVRGASAADYLGLGEQTEGSQLSTSNQSSTRHSVAQSNRSRRGAAASVVDTVATSAG